MIKTEIGRHIRELRNSKGYSQERFAQVCGLDRTYIAGVELGKRNISLENLNKIAEALEVSLGELCDVNAPIAHTIILRVNGETFILESKEELSQELKDDIEFLCRSAYDEENPEFLDYLEDGKTIDDLWSMSDYETALLFQKAVFEKYGIHAAFKRIDLEISLNTQQF